MAVGPPAALPSRPGTPACRSLTNVTGNGGTVPLPFTLPGAPGCTVNVDPLASQLLVAGPAGTWTWRCPARSCCGACGCSSSARCWWARPTPWGSR